MANLTRAALQRSTLAEQAYETLRDRIIAGELPAGERLLPEAIGQALAISPTPVKEALAMLQRDGLIEVSARRGSTVRRFSAREITDLYDARLMIEARAIGVGCAAGRVDAGFMTRVDACSAQLAERSRRRSRNELRAAFRLDHQLHVLIVGLADNPLLADWHQRLLRQTLLVRTYSLRAFDIGRLEAAQREHAAIIAGLRAQDAGEALAALQAHLATSLANVLEQY